MIVCSSAVRGALVLLVLPIAFVSSACPQAIDTARDDSGDNPPGDSGVHLDATNNLPEDATAPDAGVEPDAEPLDTGTLIPDAEPTDTGMTGPLPPLVWGEMTVPPNTRAVLSIWGRSPEEIYAGTSNGSLMYFDTTNGWRTHAWREPSNFGIKHIRGTATKIFIAGEFSLHVHTGGIQQTPQSFGVGGGLNGITDMFVVSDTEVYLTADRTNGRGLYKYDGNQILTLSEPSDVSTLGSVYKPASGPLLVGGNGAMFRYSAATLTPENVDWMGWSQNDILLFTFYTINIIGGRTFAGGDRQLIFEKDASNTWRGVHLPFAVDGDLHEIVGFQRGADLEAYAVGDNATNGPVIRFLNGTWSDNQLQANLDIHDLWASGPDDYYAAANIDNRVDGVILHATR